MNFRDLEYVIAVSEFRNFSRAAESCQVSQPSLSIQVKKLEAQLGLTIFSRGKNEVSLTPMGELVLEKAREALRIKADLERLAQSRESELSGKVRLGAILTVAPYVFPKLLRYIGVVEPHVSLALREAKTEELLQGLIRGKLEAALISLPTDRHVFDVHSVFQESFVLAVSKEHRLGRRKTVSERDFKNEKMILLEDGHCFREQALAVCSNLAAKEYSPFRSTSFESIRNLVREGEGVTLLPEIACIPSEGIVYVPLRGADYSREIALIWRKSSQFRPQLERLAELIKETLAL